MAVTINEHPLSFNESGLGTCDVCGLSEGELTTHCPGYHIHRESVRRAIYYLGRLDYDETQGGWCNQPNPTNRTLKGQKKLV